MTEVLEFELRLLHNPLAAASQRDIQRLLAFVEETNQRQDRVGVILKLVEGAHFINQEFVHELKHEVYFDELFTRMVRLRSIAAQISASRHYWVFVTPSDCLGVMFDLALACDYRFCFNTRARVGFPALEGGFLPFLGPFLERYGRSYRRRNSWLKRSILRASEAVAANLIDFAHDHNDWQADVHRWIKQRLASLEELAPGPLPQPLVDAPTSMKDALETIRRNPDLAKVRPGEKSFDALWSFAAQIKKEDLNGSLTAIMYLCARTLVSRQFLVWADRYLAMGGSIHWVEPGRSKNIYVDFDFLAPPIKPLERLIESGYKIVFCSPDGSRLKEGIDLMFARFERNFAKQESQTLWRDGIAWYVGDISLIHSLPVVRWLANDRVTVKTEDGELTFLRFLGNRGSAECGWSELSVDRSLPPKSDHQSYEIARIMSDGIVKVHKLVDDQLELSTVVRSLFLEEILAIASVLTGATGKLLPALKDAGWGYVADDNSWEYFLRSREEIYSIPAEKIRLGSLRVNPQVWNMGVWREGRQMAQLANRRQRSSWNPVYLSRHFATFAALLAEQVHRSGNIREPSDADRFVCGCLGFPSNLGTPLSFAQQLGPKRFAYYCERFWPHHRELI